MHNVLEKLREGESIEGRDRAIYQDRLVGILEDLHDRIDAAVADAYAWPQDLAGEDMLFHLVDLNHERAAEEAEGHVRWLRPEYQNPHGKAARKGGTKDMALAPKAIADKEPWPADLPARIAAVRVALAEMGEASPDRIARRFKRVQTRQVRPLLESLAALGQAERVGEDLYAA
ncbi:RNA-binding protein [Roseobacter sp. HKCCA0434]|uniref:RNA-binding protein n=1 Tax=Roseobacter sp. HKCCA0434 TaxID=3079297 RepID=UPI002905DB4E|nr:RNA-binding protein [Roseobacter sp. HKCCA0434]